MRLLTLGTAHPQNDPSLAEKDKEEKDPAGEIQTSNEFHEDLHHNLVGLHGGAIVREEEMEELKDPGYSHHTEQSETEKLRTPC